MSVKLLLGDCLERMREIPDASVDAVVTDPPYGIDYQSAWRTDRAKWKPKIAGDKQPFVWFLPQAARALRDGGCLLCFARWDTAEAFRHAIGWAGLHVGAQLVWDRVGHGMGDLKGRPSPQHDLIWFAVKGRFQLPGRRPSSVVRSARLAGCNLEHPNQKPEGLMADLLKSYLKPGGTVLDPFMGSGTTGVAAAAEGFGFIGIERDPGYFAIAEARIAQARAAMPLFAEGGAA